MSPKDYTYEATNQIFPILGNIYFEATRLLPIIFTIKIFCVTI